MQGSAFATRFERAGEAWDVALQITALRQQAGLSQKDLAKPLKTSQQQISRLELPRLRRPLAKYPRRVTDTLHARVHMVFEPAKTGNRMRMAESAALYRAKRSTTK
ncbi:MAG: helix-turn-helix transcriptional regulator [Deltaproteobacteria bacterium]|nr:helix-turn-helix transcriptional regulator [Deltaproteobacteria bacterium]